MPSQSITRLIQNTQARAQENLSRHTRTCTHAQGISVRVGERELISFASNDYLGLAQHSNLTHAMQSAANTWGVGATAAHLLGGHRAPHAALEEELAEWLGFERALLFTSGWQANLGLLGALLERGDVCVQDKLNHASLIDGARLSGATLRRYRHKDAESAIQQLQSSAAIKVLATDGVFSMDGDVAPFAALSMACQSHDAAFLIDDAHGIGVLGEQGRGAWHGEIETKQIDGLMITFGKALGTFGAAVLGSSELIEGLQQFARPWIYTTATPPALAEATRAAVQLTLHADAERAHMQHLRQLFQDCAKQIGLTVGSSASAIQTVLLGSAERAVRWSAVLHERGFYIPAIRPPTVPAHSARLRIALSAAHRIEDLEKLLDELTQLHLNDCGAMDAH